MRLCKYVLMIIIITAYFVGSYMPPSWGWENSPLEWSQVVILLAGALLTGKWWQEARLVGQERYARFFAWGIPLWLLLAGREMSWGRVFYLKGIDAVKGPSFTPISQLPYGPMIYPVIVAVVIICLFAIMKYELYKIPYELFQQRRFPISEFLLLIFAIIVANIAEKKMHYEIMEEIVECVSYLTILLITYRIKVNLLQRYIK